MPQEWTTVYYGAPKQVISEEKRPFIRQKLLERVLLEGVCRILMSACHNFYNLLMRLSRNLERQVILKDLIIPLGKDVPDS
ncbi:hypothetical protein PHSC3_000645 [Chlamydiales bacterium STE3]|nr:hypothetical protein PHSC3_000645 [Chlamydiales bacterium STE3]